MDWSTLNREEQIPALFQESHRNPVLIFKHSTRCSISAAALGRLERGWNLITLGEVTPYYLDLLRFRSVSHAVAEATGVEHQSPQLILLIDGKVRYTATHYDIRIDEVLEALGQQAA